MLNSLLANMIAGLGPFFSGLRMVDYYVRIPGQLTNVSVWDSLEHAHQMDTLQEMLAQRPILEAADVSGELLNVSPLTTGGLIPQFPGSDVWT